MQSEQAYALSNFTPTELLARCRQQQPDNAHELFCFELFRRAIVERSQQCWSAIYEQYQRLVYRWTLECTHGVEAVDQRTIEELVLDAFTAFWRAYTHQQLAKADGLASVLRYLKSCALTAVLQARRSAQRRQREQEWDDSVVDQQIEPMSAGHSVADTAEKRQFAQRLWQIVNSVCHDQREQTLAWLSFVADLKPREILQRNPDLFSDVTEVYALRRALKERLERKKELQMLWEELDS